MSTLALLGLLVSVPSTYGQQPASQANRIAAHPDLRQLVALPHHTPQWVTPANLSTKAVDPGTSLRLTLVLRRDAAVQSAFEKFLADQQTPGSPVFHQWLTPAQLGTLYGPTQADVDQVAAWVSAQGLHVDSVAPNRVLMEVSAPVASVASALRVNFSYYTLGGEARLAADGDPSVPAALAPVIGSISGLADVPVVPMEQHRLLPMSDLQAQANVSRATPNFTNGTNHYMVPGDFAAIYDINSVYAAGNTGATVGSKAQHIAIVDTSDLLPADISDWAAKVGIANYTLNTIFPSGVDPGLGSAQGESTLDSIRTIGSAPGAVTDLLVTGSAQGGVYTSAAYNVNTLLDPVLSISYGSCEVLGGITLDNKWDTLFSAAAAEGISVLVSSGDSGVAGCDTHGSAPPATQFASTSGFCASSYATCVGGTEFADTANPSLYWGATNSTSRVSALSYIPEGVWNDPTSVTNGVTTYVALAGSGGASLYFPKPSWQTGTGVPADGQRDEPDISFSASTHDGYYGCLNLSCETGFFVSFGGTSASAPGMAAVAALLNTKAGAAQGNLNPLLYRLFNSSAAASIFHDTTIASSGVNGCTAAIPSLCNNSTPSPTALTGGLAGYIAGTGYDLATGLGSLDVANFLAAAAPVATTLALKVSATTLATGQAVTFTATLTPAASSVASPTGTVQFVVDGSNFGSPVTLSANAATSASDSFTGVGVHNITAVYSGDAFYQKATAAAVVQVSVAGNLALSATPATLAFTSGATSGNTVAAAVTSGGGFTGTVGLTCAISASSAAFQPTCSVSPASVTLAAGGTGSATVTISSTVAQASLVVPPAPGWRGKSPSRPELAAISAAGVLASLFLGLLPARRRRRFLRIAASLCLAGIAASLTACGGGKSSGAGSPPTLRSSAGTYTVTVNGSGTQTGTTTAVTASTTFTVTIN